MRTQSQKMTDAVQAVAAGAKPAEAAARGNVTLAALYRALKRHGVGNVRKIAPRMRKPNLQQPAEDNNQVS